MYSLAPNHYLCLDLAISYWLDWPIGTILPTFPSNNVKINHTAFKATTSIPKSLLKYSGKTYSELHEVGKEQNKISSVVNVVKSIFRTWWSTMFIRAMITPTWQATEPGGGGTVVHLCWAIYWHPSLSSKVQFLWKDWVNCSFLIIPADQANENYLMTYHKIIWS